MQGNDPRHWAPFEKLDPTQGTIVRQPPGEGPGYWAGAPGAMYDPQSKKFYLTYRLRRPRGVEPDRGAEVHIASSSDGINFDDIWSATKDQVDSTSIERSALVRLSDGTWRMYTSYVNPTDRRWLISLFEADSPDKFDLRSAKPVLTAADIGAEGVKDPFVFNIAGLYHMVVSYAIKAADSAMAGNASADDMHGTNDAYNTGLILSCTGLATSHDGIDWRWEGPIMKPDPNAWDCYCARIGTLWYQPPVWLAFYDGSTDVSENYEERCGLAYSSDLRTFHRVTPNGPLLKTPQGVGAMRYFDVVQSPDGTFIYYEMAQPDGSHDMRVLRV